MKTVEEALEIILAQTLRRSEERVPLLDSVGRILSEGIASDIPLPPFDNSAMDGYAVRAEDVAGATPETPVTLRLIADIPAGVQPTETIVPGTAARILTGAMMPSGADAVVMQEETRPGENASSIAVLEAVKPEQHVRLTGEDVACGEVILRAGARIRPQEIALLATVGKANVPTIRPPRVAVVSTGDEVVEIEEGVAPPPGKIRNSNQAVLAALVGQSGGTLHSLTHIPDDPEATENAIRILSHPETGADVIVTAGGVSVGDRDYVKPALEKLGTLELWRVAMKPGKPLAFGSVGDTLFFGLPGNPISAMVTFLLFVRPVLRKMAGYPETEWSLPSVTATVTEAIPHFPGRREYIRAHLSRSPEGGYHAEPTGGQGSSTLHSLHRANALLIVPEASEGVEPGEKLMALWFD